MLLEFADNRRVIATSIWRRGSSWWRKGIVPLATSISSIRVLEDCISTLGLQKNARIEISKARSYDRVLSPETLNILEIVEGTTSLQ